MRSAKNEVLALKVCCKSNITFAVLQNSMKVHLQLSSLPTFKNAAITIGTFDGVHFGHQKIIENLISTAKKANGESVLISFEPHPRTIINPGDTSLRLLQTLQEKINALSELGIDHFVVVPFTEAFRNFTATQYIEDFLVNYFSPHTIIIGYDHHFGHNREGNINLLKKVSSQYNFTVVEISQQLIQSIEVSSTVIRKSLLAGDLEKANNLLQHPYCITGTVVHGDARGRTIGYPTANIAIHNKYKLIPANGVYAVQSFFQGEVFGGMMNIGTRPTIENTNKVSLEAHFFNFNKDIYDENISVNLLYKLRDEKKFEGLASLIAAIKADEVAAKKILGLL
jgi:riboflavin kinase / FMN adenylyltransferase